MTLAALTDRLLAAHARLEAVRPVVAAGAPWPPSPNFGVEPEARWNPPELLAHLAEMLPYWLGQIDRILAGMEPVPFGRVASDEGRIEAIGRDRERPVGELFDRIGTGVDDVVARVASLDPAAAARRGTHPTRGEMTVEQVTERMVTSHFEEHVAQLEAILETGAGA
ncbi:MAG: DinB family protein [Chloroflexota bacterium]